MKVSIIGAGYVGLVSGICLAEKGHEVICVDVDQAKLDRINKGDAPIYEKDLPDLLRRNLGQRFQVTTDFHQSILDTDLTLIAVGTPFHGDSIDLRFIRQAASQIGDALRDKNGYHVIAVKSTVVPGTTDEVVTPLLEQQSGKKSGRDFGVGMNPEFLREGNAINDFLFPDRIVLGAIDGRTTAVLEDLYQPFHGVDRLRTNPRTAETIKYASNALLATMISFSNEIANLCTAIGDVDVVEVMRGVHLDRRLSPILSDGKRIEPQFLTYLEAGCGFGGSCFPKDVRALIAHGKKAGERMSLLDAVMEVNNSQPFKVLSSLYKHFPVLAGVRVAILGLAFKPGTNDMRESPAIPIVNELIDKRALVKAFDPVAREEAQKVFGNGALTFAETLAEAIAEAQAIILLTRWPEFEKIPNLLSALDEPPVLIDGRRMFNKNSVPKYEGIGLSKAASIDAAGVLESSAI